MMSPPGHPFMMEVMEYMAKRYNSCCYAVANTGPDALTKFWNDKGTCEKWKKDGVLLTESFLGGPIGHHHCTGVWRDSEQVARRLGQEGCKWRWVRCRDCEECLA